MNCLEAAEHRYRDIVAPSTFGRIESPQFLRTFPRKIKSWIYEYVVPAVQDIRQRPLFRRFSEWPQSQLVAGVDSPERKTIDEIQELIRREARQLLRLAGRRLIQRELEGLDNVRFDPQIAENSLNCIASGRICDLVCIDDYFGAVANSFGEIDSFYQDGSFVTAINPELFHVGDCVTNCLIHRINLWQEEFRNFRNCCHQAIRRTRWRYQSDVSSECETWSELNDKVTLLDGLCRGSDYLDRSACMTLTQIFVACKPAADVEYLGVDNKYLERWRALFKSFVYDVRKRETADRIAGALSRVQLLYRNMEPDRRSLEVAVATGALVIVDQGIQRKVYWKGEPLDFDGFKHKKEWEFFTKLVTQSRSLRSLENTDVYKTDAGESNFANLRKRTRPHLPPSLNRLIVPGDVSKSYRLDLPRNQIYINPI